MTRVLKYKTTIRLIERILSDRNFKVEFNGEIGKKKVIQNDLPQGSVLSTLLFNVYTADIVNTTSRKFTYADDVGLISRGTTISEVESTLGRQRYFKTSKIFQKLTPYLKRQKTDSNRLSPQ